MNLFLQYGKNYSIKNNFNLNYAINNTKNTVAGVFSFTSPPPHHSPQTLQ
jgi:hypothetical protein